MVYTESNNVITHQNHMKNRKTKSLLVNNTYNKTLITHKII